MTGADPEVLRTYFRLMNTNGAAQVYQTALQFGMLDALENEALTAAELAGQCETAARPTLLTLEALASLNVVRAEGDRYRLSDVMGLILHSEYRELGNQYWVGLKDFLRTGQPLKRMDARDESESHYQTQVAMLGWMLTPAAAEACEQLSVGIERRGISILDVGAGSAIWSLTMAARDLGCRVTANDWPSILEVAEETAETLGVSDQLTTLPGDFHELEWPVSAFELVIVANVSHLLTEEENVRLFTGLAKALRPGGELLIVDAMPAGERGDAAFALYHLGLALRTEIGRVHAVDALKAMVRQAGFADPRLLTLDSPPHMVGMLLARLA